jgi:hypothetical protein
MITARSPEGPPQGPAGDRIRLCIDGHLHRIDPHRAGTGIGRSGAGKKEGTAKDQGPGI